MSRKIIAKSSSNQRSGPEQRRVHDAGTSSMCKESCDVQFATICCLRMPSSAVIQRFGHSALEKDSLLRTFVLTTIIFITQAEIFLQENATLADISSEGEASLVCMYTGAMGDTLDTLRLQRFHLKEPPVHVLCSLKTFIRRHQLPSTIAFVFTSMCKYGRGNQGLVHICKALEDKLLPVQCDMDVAPKALLKVVRWNCKMGCDTLRCSCRKAGLNCSTGCGEC